MSDTTAGARIYRIDEEQQRRANQTAWPSFVADGEALTDAGLLEFAGDGTDGRRVTLLGLRAAAILLTFARHRLLAYLNDVAGDYASAEGAEDLDFVTDLVLLVAGVRSLGGCPAGGEHHYAVEDESPAGPARVVHCTECGATP